MPTATQARRLIEGIAYIESHRDLWDQSHWHSVDKQIEQNSCGTVGCLAGHIALTLNPHRTVVKIDKKLLQKPEHQRTAREQDQVSAIYSYADFVRATSDDFPDAVHVDSSTPAGAVPIVHVRNRAAQLIGLPPSQAGGDTGIFDGRNTLSDIYVRSAEHLGIGYSELTEMVKAAIVENGWDKDAEKRAAAAR